MQFTGNSGAAPKGKSPPAYVHTKCKGVTITDSTQRELNQLCKTKSLLACQRAVVHRSHTSNKSHHTYLTRNASPMHPRRGCRKGMLLSHLPNDRITPESISPTQRAAKHSLETGRGSIWAQGPELLAQLTSSGARWGSSATWVQNESIPLSPVPAQIHTLNPTETQGFG